MGLQGGTPTFTAEFKTKGGMRPPAIASGQHGSLVTPPNSQPLLQGLLGLTPSKHLVVLNLFSVPLRPLCQNQICLFSLPKSEDVPAPLPTYG